MQPMLRRIRPRPSRALPLWDTLSRTTTPASNGLRAQHSTSEARSDRDSNAQHSASLSLTSREKTQTPWIPVRTLQTASRQLSSEGWTKDLQIGGEAAQSQVVEAAKELLRSATADIQLSPGDIDLWDRLLLEMRRKHGEEGVWETFQLIQKHNCVSVLAHSRAMSLRDEIVAAALGTTDRIAQIVEVARTLSVNPAMAWPHLYFDVLHYMLRNSLYDDAVLWHLRLAPLFPPETDVFGSLMRYFAVDATPKMQSSLTTMYIFNPDRRMYDVIIPALHASGHSVLARKWRATLLNYEDTPQTSESLPFLDFLRRYYPFSSLVDQEKALLSQSRRHPEHSEDDEQRVENESPPNRIYTDSMVAKWFASSWTSVEFAVSLVHRLGLRSIGPRSLQSLALREPDPKGVTSRIAQLEQLGIALPNKLYAKAISSFAKLGNSKLLTALLHCDVHPDEFEDAETRKLLLSAAVKDGDEDMRELMLAMDITTEEDTQTHPLQSVLVDSFADSDFFRAKVVLDRMEALTVLPNQSIASRMLRFTYAGAVLNKRRELRKSWPGSSIKPSLERAIETTVQMAGQGIAIRVRDWRDLLRNLAWSRRLTELEQLSLKIVDLYDPKQGALIAVHRADAPDASLSKTISDAPQSAEDKRRENRWRRIYEGRRFVPSDLPFSHSHHPVRQIFDVKMQRSIMRWGFNQTLLNAPATQPLLIDPESARPEQFDIARGVRLLAMLRDRGVIIDRQMIKATLPRHIALGQVPSRRHERRDSQSISAEATKRLLDQAWGSAILDELPALTMQIQRQERKLWVRYPVLYGHNFDDGFDYDEESWRKATEAGDQLES